MPTVEVEVSRQMFILRFWHEPSQERPGAWRGSVDHVESGKRFYFAHLDDMQDFIRKALDRGGAGKAPSSSGDVE